MISNAFQRADQARAHSYGGLTISGLGFGSGELKRHRRLSVAVRRQPAFPRLAVLAAVTLAGLALASAGGSVSAFDDTRSGPGGPAAGGAAVGLPCPTAFVIDFAGLPAGTVLGEQYSGLGVHISAVANGEGFPDVAIGFDSNSTDESLDSDLRVGIGNIALLADNLTDVKPPPSGDGLVDRPDENIFGGKQIYAFDEPVHIGSFLFIDKDHGTPDKAIAYDASNNAIAEAPIPLAGNGSVQPINVDADNVSRLEIVYRDSGALTGIEVGCSAPPTPSPTPLATSSPPSPSPSATPDPTPTATAVVILPETATPAPTLTVTATPTPTPTALDVVSLPTAGGRLGLVKDRPIAVGLVGAVFLLVAAELLVLRSGRSGRKSR
jgi:hypothetical protein